MGHAIEEIQLDYIEDASEYWKAYFIVMMANTDVTVSTYSNKTSIVPTYDLFEKWTWLNLQRSKYNSATNFLKSLQLLHRTGRRIAQLFQTYDILVTPTLAKPPPSIGYLDTMLEFEEYSTRSGEFFPFTACFNVSGNPAMSVPLHITSDNIPIGVQFVGRYGDEATLFQLASALEKAKPWSNRYSYEYC